MQIKNPKIILLLIPVVLTAAVFMPLSKRLCIIKSESSAIVEVFDRNTDSFVISYTHSVNRGRVRDYYSLTNGNALCLTHTAFTSYGAGMPEPFGDQVFTVTEDAIEISNINLKLKELILQTGLTANHHIDTDSKHLVLNDITAPQTRIVIKIKRVSFYKIFKFYFRNLRKYIHI